VDADDLLNGIVGYIVLLLSLTVHEAAHAWAALRGGDPTAYLGGQVSLDPRPHIRREPLGMVIAPLLFWFLGHVSQSRIMLGWASTPIDPRWAYVHPKRAAAMAAAGPLANLALAALSGAILRLGVELGWFLPVPTSTFELARAVDGGIGAGAIQVLSWIFSLNLVLFVFNLIPVPPLDGASVIGLFLSEQNARRLQEWMAQPMLAFGGLVLAWLLMRRIVWPVLGAAVDVLYLGA
jgi:Zn-dependent protease